MAKAKNSDRTVAESKKRSPIHGWLVAALAFLMFAGLIAGLGVWGVHRWARLPFGGAEEVTLTIPRGASLREVARQLEHEGVIASADAFVAYACLRRRQGTLQAGRYEITLPITPDRVIDRLRRGTFERKLTIPEGWTATQIEKALIEDGWINREGQWRETISEPAESDVLGEALGPGAEGFCFPDTYFFEEGTGARRICDRMIERFASRWQTLNSEERDDRARGLTLSEIVTLASIVEREARRTEEMPRIASVFLNRLKINMRLQSCATVYYALGGAWDRPLKKADLEIDSPYNTYQIRGLPAGPIGNPGLDALAAVLRPAKTKDLYFVYRGDGTHEFTRTYKQHLKAVRRFRKADWAAQYAESSR